MYNLYCTGCGNLTELPRVAPTGGAYNAALCVEEGTRQLYPASNSTGTLTAYNRPRKYFSAPQVFRSKLPFGGSTFPVPDLSECPFLAARPAYQPHPRWIL